MPGSCCRTRRLQDAFDSNVCHLLLRPHGFGVAAALTRIGFAQEAAAALLADPVATAGAEGPGEALLALAAHWSLTRDEGFADRAVPLVASLVAKLGRSGTPAELRLGAIAAAGAAGLLASVGQTRGAEDVRRAGEAMSKASSAPAPPPAPSGVEPLLDAAQDGVAHLDLGRARRRPRARSSGPRSSSASATCSSPRPRSGNPRSC